VTALLFLADGRQEEDADRTSCARGDAGRFWRHRARKAALRGCGIGLRLQTSGGCTPGGRLEPSSSLSREGWDSQSDCQRHASLRRQDAVHVLDIHGSKEDAYYQAYSQLQTSLAQSSATFDAATVRAAAMRAFQAEQRRRASTSRAPDSVEAFAAFGSAVCALCVLLCSHCSTNMLDSGGMLHLLVVRIFVYLCFFLSL